MYTDLVTKIRNAQQAKKEVVRVMFSNMDFAICTLLARHGYVEAVQKKGRLPKRILEIKLKYNAEGRGAMLGARFVSKPSFARYRGYRDLHPVRQGYGIAIISTPKGIMTSEEARKSKTGGKVLLEVW